MVTPQPELLDTVLRYLDHTDAGLHSAVLQNIICSTIEACVQAHHLWGVNHLLNVQSRFHCPHSSNL